MSEEFEVEYVVNTATISMQFQQDYTVKDIRSMQDYLQAMLERRDEHGGFSTVVSGLH